MKISKIKISKFHQFEDFELDLTYPKGHEKAGKPLDKVCFIGQSGTGKTTLLEMILDAHRKSYQRDVDKLLPFEASKSSAISTFLQKGNTNEIEIDLFNPTTFYPKDSLLYTPWFYFPSGLPSMNLFANDSFASTYNTKNHAEIGCVNEHRFNTGALKDVWNKLSTHVS